MAITTAMCNSFKKEILEGVHNLETDTLRVALIKESPTGTYDASTTNYSDLGADEASGTNYTADSVNNNLDVTGTNVYLDTVAGVAYVDFPDLVFSNLTISADGAMIYNVSQSDKAIAVFDFGGTVTSTAGDFTVVFPTADASNAVIRIS